jgi:hypothetical protein
MKSGITYAISSNLKLDAILKLQIVDLLFLQNFNAAPEDKSEFIRYIQDNNCLDIIIRVAHADTAFETFCKTQPLEDHWNKIFCGYGFTLTQDQTNPIAFHSHADMCVFDLIRGAYFFHKAQLARKPNEKDFSWTELQLLKQALKYTSIHAMQRYHEYLYREEEMNNSLDQDYEQKFYEIIENCKSMTSCYGSYAYLMLAEAYLRYGTWLDNQGKDATNAYKAALNSCSFADNILKESQYSIENASLGGGLKCSNSLQLETPAAAKKYIADKLVALTGENKLSDESKKSMPTR